MNDNYTATTQVQKGFKTFILTLSVSLIIFSIIYYFISDAQPMESLNSVADNEDSMVLASNDTEEDIEEAEDKTVFGQISASPVVTTSRAVLAGSTTGMSTGLSNAAGTRVSTAPASTAPDKVTSGSAVPNGGVTELTWGFFVSMISFALGFIVISKDPRRVAMQHFEEKMLNKK